jgi:hypothetical protein
MFRRKAKGVDPFGNPKRYIWGYYVTTPGQVVERPPEGKKCFLSLLQDNSINERYSVARGVAEVVDLTNEITKQSKAKRKAQAQNIAQDESKRARNGPVSGNLVELTYWDSPEAKKLFLGDSNDSRNVVEVLQQRIERLQDANRTMDGWRDVIVRRDIDNLCSAYDIFIIRQRCSILSLAYTVALEEMNSSRWIEDCCGAALNTGSLMGLEAAATSVKTVAAWNILLRANRENFPHPNPRMHQDKKPLPELLEYFQEEIRLPWQQFCIENLSDLTVEMAKDQLMIKIIPSAVESVKKEESTSDNASSNNDEDNKNKNKRLKQDSLLHRYLQSPISSSTTWRWLHSLGFSYKKLPNGLDAYSMNKGFGGVQPQMRESTIKQHNGYLGSHPLTINVGEIQSFTFKSTDDGPFWMSPDQRELNRHDRILPLPPGPPRMQNKTISELKAELAPLGVLNDRRNYRLKELQDIAEQKNVETKKVRVTEKKGWEGRAKGLLQVLWERGWIDVSQLDRYTIEAATDENGQVLEGAEEWSLKCLMASCLDFAEELTALQHVGSQLGVSVIITPKFHAELAGEGVEYSWGITKGLYRRKPLLSKKGKESFRKLVCEVTSRDVLKTLTIRKLSRRARAYICAYYSLYESKNRGIDTTKLTLPLIERVVKAFKTHRAALDFDAGFVNGLVHVIDDGVIVIDE